MPPSEALRLNIGYEATRELWARGLLNYKLRPEQALFKDEIERNAVMLFVGNISRRWGKSFTLVLFAIEQCLKNPGLKIRYGAAFRTDLEEFILPAFAIILEDCPDDLRPTFRETKKTWRFPNGSEIKLVGLDKNPNGLRGNAISIIIIDEAGFISKLRYIYTSIIIPATAKQRNIRLVFVSTPPESPEHYFVSLIDKAQANGYYSTQTIDEISDLTDQEKERLLEEVGGRESVTAQREFYCRIIVDETRAICGTFDPDRHVGKYVRPEHGLYIVSGDTGGVKDLTCIHIATYDWLTQKIWFVAERWFFPKTPSSKWVPDALDMEKGYPHGMGRYVDAQGQTQIDLGFLGYMTALPKKDDFDSSLGFLRNAFLRNEVMVDESCELLIRTLKGGLLNERRSDFLRTESMGHADAVMSAVYGLRHVDRTTNPIPRSPKTVIFNANNPETRQISTLKNLFKL